DGARESGGCAGSTGWQEPIEAQAGGGEKERETRRPAAQVARPSLSDFVAYFRRGFRSRVPSPPTGPYNLFSRSKAFLAAVIPSTDQNSFCALGSAGCSGFGRRSLGRPRLYRRPVAVDLARAAQGFSSKRSPIRAMISS